MQTLSFYNLLRKEVKVKKRNMALIRDVLQRESTNKQVYGTNTKILGGRVCLSLVRK